MSERSWLRVREAATPDAAALSLAGGDLSWRDLAARARGVGGSLALQGVRPGDLVATLLRSTDFAPAVHGIWQSGATVLPINLRLTAPEIAFQLRDAGAQWLVHDASDLAATVLAAAPGLQSLSVDGDGCRTKLPPFDPARPLAVLYTSGTTGRPKGAELTGENFRANSLASQRQLGSRPSDRCLACMPLYHVGGLAMLVRSVLLGSCVQVQEGFDPSAVANALEADRITDVSFVANMLARVLEVRGSEKSPPRLRNVLLGGGPVPEPLLQEARLCGYPVAATYGLTEATSQVATRAPADRDAIGLRPLPGVEVRVEAEAGGGGEILVRGPTVMSGYRNRPDETARALAGGWLHTGDIGTLHPDGTLSVLDRRSDLIVSGGENIYPAEIESVLLAHPEIAEAGVGRQADSRYGARPVAWYVATAGARPAEESLVRFCRERLAAFKVPVAFHPARELPRTSSGKLVRAKLGQSE